MVNSKSSGPIRVGDSKPYTKAGMKKAYPAIMVVGIIIAAFGVFLLFSGDNTHFAYGIISMIFGVFFVIDAFWMKKQANKS